jgi:hypothetical protein
MGNLATIPVQNAKLPVSYERAREALAQCHKVDECKEWADKAAALKSYAKQAQDDSLFQTAMKIQGRAIRRAGELLQEIEVHHGVGGGRPATRPVVEPSGPTMKHRTDTHTMFPAPTPPAAPVTRAAAAEAAGLSKHQKDQALRIAAIPAQEFEAAIEAPTPPTITELAERGTMPRPQPAAAPKPAGPPAYLCGRTPDEFNAAIHARGRVRDLAVQCRRVTADAVAVTSTEAERAELRAWLSDIAPWIEALSEAL